jgi:hypothetical protein
MRGGSSGAKLMLRGPFDDTGNLVGRFISTMGLQRD